MCSIVRSSFEEWASHLPKVLVGPGEPGPFRPVCPVQAGWGTPTEAEIRRVVPEMALAAVWGSFGRFKAQKHQEEIVSIFSSNLRIRILIRSLAISCSSHFMQCNK